MKKLRKSVLMKPLSIILAVLTMNLTFYSCNKDDESSEGNGNNYEIPVSQFNGNSIAVETDEVGKYNVHTEISSQGEDFDLTYEFQVVDQSGNPIEGITITYNQLNEKSIIYINDEPGRYASTFFIGTPREMDAYFAGSSNKNGPYASPLAPLNSNNYKESEFLVTLTVVAVITILSIGAAEIGFILNAYKVQEFYLTDYVTETEDYILYCKTFDEIAELIKARTNMVLHLTSIFVSYISLGGSGPSYAIELTNTVGAFVTDNIRMELINSVMTRGGLLKPISAGIYEINDTMLHDLLNGDKWHAVNLGSLIAKKLTKKFEGSIASALSSLASTSSGNSSSVASNVWSCWKLNVFNVLL